MKRWQTWSNGKKLCAGALMVGGLLSGIAWLKPNTPSMSNVPNVANMEKVAGPSTRLAKATPNAATTQKTGVAATLPAAVPRSCADVLHTSGKDTTSDIQEGVQDDVRLLVARRLAIPVAGVEKSTLYDSFNDGRGSGKHHAIDIHAPRGTPVIAAGDGCVVKLFRSIPGGITLYQFDPQGNFVYYYAHLDRYADDVKEGMQLQRGDILGYVGTTGNAPANTPHLHFSIYRLGPEKRWWKGTAVNPYTVLTYP